MGKFAAREKSASKIGPPAGLPEDRRRPVLLTVAGFDPSSGAGIAADLKTFWNHGFFGVSAITALTVQSTRGVAGVEPVPGELLRRTLDHLAADLPLAGVKIGMLGSAEAVGEVADFLRRAERELGLERARVVLDPVLRSSSGAELLEPAGVEKLRSELLPQVGWTTPNLDELALLIGKPLPQREAVPSLAHQLAALSGGLNLVVTGGHLSPPDDYLLTAEGEERWFPGRKIETTSTHGTGCVFSSALLCRLVLGDAPADAVAAAKAFVTQALETAVPIGTGRGPVLG